jgi:hypothetical protein
VRGEERVARLLGPRKRKWAGLAHAGVRGKGPRRRGREGEGSGELGWAKEVGCSLLFPFLSFFFTLTIQTKPFEFK